MRGEKQERILRVLLTEGQPLSKNKLSIKAECTRSWVIQFLRKLEKMNLVKGTKITNKKELIKYSISIHKPYKKNRTYSVKRPRKLLENAKMDYVLTGTHAETIVHHYLFPTRAIIYIKKEDLQNWHEYFTEDGLYGGGNMRVVPADPHIFYSKQKLKKLWLVNIPQLIVDLWHENGPSREAAEMILENVHKY